MTDETSTQWKFLFYQAVVKDYLTTASNENHDNETRKLQHISDAYKFGREGAS